MNELPLPNNNEAEQAVLGAILLEQNIIDQVLEILSPDDFYKEAHSKLYQAMIDLHGDKNPIDLLTLFDYLKPNGHIMEEVGGSSYLTSLLDAVPSTANVYYYVDLVRRASQERVICQICTKIDHEVRSGNIDIDNAIESIDAVTNYISISASSNANSEVVYLSEYKCSEMEWLIEKIIPKYYPIMIYAEGGIGKSLLALYICILATLGGQKFLGYKFCDEPQNVLYVDYELNLNEIALRAEKLSKGLGLYKTPNIRYWRPRISLSRSSGSLANTIKSLDIDLVVIDSLSASGVDAENVQDIVSLFSELNTLGVSVLILDHQAKQQYKDTYRQKTPYGSVFKYNLSRSVFQLSCIQRNKDSISLLLRHTKSNFGILVNDIGFHIDFEEDQTLFTSIEYKTSEEKYLKEIYEAIKLMTHNGSVVNQKMIIEHFKGAVGRDKLINLLDKGEGMYWETKRGERKEKIYIPITLKPDDI